MNDLNNLKQTYNDIPYTSKVFSSCQPTRLHALAKIKGLNPPILETANVLEIGCSFGGNLLPFAFKYPKSNIVGVDLAENQICIGKQMIEEIGISNIQLIAGDISEISFSDTKFDYIICHGVFSWVPETVQNAILDTIQKYLSPNGIAFISYNTYPGWYVKGMARELMLFASDNKLDPFSRIDQSLEVLKYTNNITNRINNPLSKEIDNIFNKIINSSKYYITHEYFEKYNQPLYFREFNKKINKYNLTYITDSSIPTIKFTFLFTEEEYQQICTYFNNHIEYIEQYTDILINKTFRESIITREENIKNYDINSYEMCHSFYDIYIKPKFEKVKDSDKDYWKIENTNITLVSNELTDKIIQFLSIDETISVKSLFDKLKNESTYNEDTIKKILYYCIHSMSSFISYTPEYLKKPSKKPRISKKLRKLIEYVGENPDVVSLFNHVDKNVTLDPLSQYLSLHMDGTRTIEDLVILIREALDKNILKWISNGSILENHQIKDLVITEHIEAIIEQLYKNGFFNDY